MSTFSMVFFVLLTCLTLRWHPVQASVDTIPARYELVWADEFDREGPPNPSNWNFEKGFVRNQEDQWYQTENAWCQKGLLIIEARREKKPNPNFLEGSTDWKRSRSEIAYSSSSLKTSGLRSWKYGRFEMRGRIDTSAGMWPAWWTLGLKGRWPSNGEIDIMEFYRGKLLANIACGTLEANRAQWFSVKKAVNDFADKAWAQKFHVWRMDWDEDSVSLYIDDLLLNSVPMNALYNKDSTGINPFAQEHYMLLNLAIGGQNGGDPSGTSFPRRFEVDYVRVYQRVRSAKR